MRWAAVGVLAVVGWAVTAIGDPPPAPPAPAKPTPSPVPVGYGGCSARGCHGGPETNPDGLRLPADWPNAATNWLRHDPHPRAYRTLLTEKSRDIAKHLGSPDAATDARCLACHGSPSLADRPGSPEVFRLRAEGVGCEACHTTPGRSTLDWFDAHTKGNAPDGLARCYADGGMMRLDTTASRVAVCVGCHVGAPADPGRGLPAREVTHDLIAAGHPRLTFEYATFVAALPPHWQERPENAGAVRTWFAGQVASAKANLLLLAEQATRQNPWPELAATNCYACHHDLTPGLADRDGWRQRRMAERRKLGLGGLGSLPWAGVPDPLRELAWPDAEFARTYTELTRTLAKPGANPATAADLARRLAAKLDTLPVPGASELPAKLRLADRDATAFDWDDAAQTYYALRAANQDRGGVASAELDAAAKGLRLNRAESASPVGFDPVPVAEALRAAAQKLSP